jgi:putative NIF3 family GTP cyclohydrolase 1 type 2
LCEKLGLIKDYRICNGLVNICTIDETDFMSFAEKAEKELGIPLRILNSNGKAKKVAVCGGGGKSFVDDVALEGADTYITGEVDHPKIIDAKEYNLNLILGSHYGTEALVLPFLAKTIKDKFPEIPVFIKYTNEFSI